MMNNWYMKFYCNLSKVPLESSRAAAVTPIYPSTSGGYQVPHCLAGSNHPYGDAAFPTPAKAKSQKPVCKQAHKRHHPEEKFVRIRRRKPDGCSSLKIPRLECYKKRSIPQTFTPTAAGEEKPVGRRGAKRHHLEESCEEDLGCPSAKIPRLQLCDNIPIHQTLTPADAGAEEPILRRGAKRYHPEDNFEEDLGCPSAKIPRLDLEDKLTPKKVAPTVRRRILKRPSFWGKF
ncbi:hypothetical protein HJG60_008578 [Phyllostomus discolor]|uniref:Uncharacterized protein n=1 Tax=Phyllostomus discolor TaxID=89673 RepID=A0A833Z1J1_9CHIR|nr:hypothetical protein HJG60_008578 [Phyllostomus discolor]